MFVFEITNLFRQYCDEPDTTWLTAADVASYLLTGYNEFRWKVSDMAPHTYAVDVSLPAASTTQYDLASAANPVRVLGNNLSAGVQRLMQLIQVRTPAGSVPNDLVWKSAQGLRDLQSTSRSYFLQGTTLYLSFAAGSDLTLTYIPENSVNWANTATGGGAEYVDDLSMWHDIIALLAYKQYSIRDANVNQPLMMQLGLRLRELEAYMNRRNYEGVQYIRRTAGSYEDV